MAKIPDTAKARRIDRVLGELIIDLYTQSGLCWKWAQWTRKRYQVIPVVQLPPVNPLDLPRGAISQIRLTGGPAMPLDIDFEFPITRLGHPWEWISGALLYFAPPKDGLRDYRDRLHSLLTHCPIVQDHSREPGETSPDLPPPGLSIRLMPDPGRVEQWWWRRESLLRQSLYDQLTALGIDFAPIWGEAIRASSSKDQPEPGDRPFYGPATHYIGPLPATKAEVTAAFDWLERHGWPSAATPPGREKKRDRDPLTCVQCALWYDECEWSHKQIAERFDWAVQPSHYAKYPPRSETARAHIAKGRDILKKRRKSAH